MGKSEPKDSEHESADSSRPRIEDKIIEEKKEAEEKKKEDEEKKKEDEEEE